MKDNLLFLVNKSQNSQNSQTNEYSREERSFRQGRRAKLEHKVSRSDSPGQSLKSSMCPSSQLILICLIMTILHPIIRYVHEQLCGQHPCVPNQVVSCLSSALYFLFPTKHDEDYFFALTYLRFCCIVDGFRVLETCPIQAGVLHFVTIYECCSSTSSRRSNRQVISSAHC